MLHLRMILVLCGPLCSAVFHIGFWFCLGGRCTTCKGSWLRSVQDVKACKKNLKVPWTFIVGEDLRYVRYCPLCGYKALICLDYFYMGCWEHGLLLEYIWECSLSLINHVINFCGLRQHHILQSIKSPQVINIVSKLTGS